MLAMKCAWAQVIDVVLKININVPMRVARKGVRQILHDFSPQCFLQAPPNMDARGLRYHVQ
jgi:hypothetical protein